TTELKVRRCRMASSRLLKSSLSSFREPRSGCPESILPVALVGKDRGYGFRAPATQVGFSRLGHALTPISGKPEIGGRPRNDRAEFFSSLLALSLRQRLCDFAGMLDEKPRDRAERAVLQGDDTDRHGGNWQFDRQDLELRPPGRESQCGRGKNRKKTPARQEAHSHVGRNGENRRRRIIEPAAPEGFHC